MADALLKRKIVSKQGDEHFLGLDIFSNQVDQR